MKEIDKKFGVDFWMDMYAKIRYREASAIMSTSTFNQLTKNASQLGRHYTTAVGLDYINEKLIGFSNIYSPAEKSVGQTTRATRTAVVTPSTAGGGSTGY